MSACCVGGVNIRKNKTLAGAKSGQKGDHNTNLSFSSCSRRSSSSLSLCSRACLRFSARMRVASSGLLVPAMGLAEGTGDTTATSGEVAVFLTGVMDVGGEDVTMAGTTGDPNVQQRNYR